MMLSLLFSLWSMAFAVDLTLEPHSTFDAEEYVAIVLNRIPYDQARPTPDGRLQITGSVRLDLRLLDTEMAARVMNIFADFPLRPEFRRYDLTEANMEFVRERPSAEREAYDMVRRAVRADSATEDLLTAVRERLREVVTFNRLTGCDQLLIETARLKLKKRQAL